MSIPTMRKYPAACQKRAVKRAIEAEQPMAQTARAFGVQAHTCPPWSGKSPRAERQGQQVQDAHLSAALKRLRQEHARFKAERDIVKQAVAYCAPPRP